MAANFTGRMLVRKSREDTKPCGICGVAVYCGKDCKKVDRHAPKDLGVPELDGAAAFVRQCMDRVNTAIGAFVSRMLETLKSEGSESESSDTDD